MRSIVGLSVKFRRIFIALAAGLIVYGVFNLAQAKQDTLPEFNPVMVEVQTEALGLSAAEVERLITVPLEQDLLNGVAFLEEIESASLPGLSSVIMTFEEGTPLLDARQVVAERLTQSHGLPQVAGQPQMLQPKSSTSRVSMVSLSSNELTPIEISVLARWVIVPRLLGVEGVAHASIWGFKDRQLQVRVDPRELIEQNISLEQVISTAGNALEVSPLTFLEASSPGTGGFIDTVNQRLHVFHEQAISTAEELARVPLEDEDGGTELRGGQPVALGDVTEIVEDHQPLIGDARCSVGDCVMLVIEKFPEANTPQVVENVDAALALLAPGLKGIDIDSSLYRPSDYIEESASNVGIGLGIGMVLLVVVVMMAMNDWRLGLMTVASIAVSVVTAALVLQILDVTFNAMTVAGLLLALLVIVDDAIVAAWAAGRESAGKIVTKNDTLYFANLTGHITRARSAAQYAALIAAVVVLTFYFLPGLPGAFLGSVAGAYLLAIAVAMLVNLTLMTSMAVELLRDRTVEMGGGSFKRISSWFQAATSRTLERPGLAVFLAILVIVGGAIAIPAMTRDFRPELKERNLLISLEALPGTSLARMDAVTADLMSDVKALPDVTDVGAHVGRAILSDQIVNVNASEIWLTIDESADYQGTLEAVEGLANRSEIDAQVTTYSGQQIDEMLGGARDELTVRVFGTNPDILNETANRVNDIVADTNGVVQSRLELPIQEETIEIEVDLDRAQEVGLKPGDVRRRAATLVSGIVVGNLFEEQKVFDVVVWGVPEIRQTVQDIRDIPIPTDRGAIVTMADVADVRVAPNIAVINHDSVLTYVDVLARVGNRAVADVAADIESAIAQQTFPLEYYALVLDGFATERAELTTVAVIVAAVAITVYLLLQAALNSWRLATLIFLLLTIAPGGALLALWITGVDLSLGSLAGVIAIGGLAARNAIMLVQRYQMQKRSGEPFGRDLVLGTTSRLAVPTLTPLFALLALFAPILVLAARPGMEIVGPMAVAVVGGLIATALLVVVILPALYFRFGAKAVTDTSTDDLYTIDLREKTREEVKA